MSGTLLTIIELDNGGWAWDCSCGRQGLRRETAEAALAWARGHKALCSGVPATGRGRSDRIAS